MSRFVSSDEFWNQIRKNVLSTESSKGSLKLNYKKSFGNFKIDNYNTGSGIRYMSFNGVFFQDTILENNNSNDMSFLCMNTGDDICMVDSIKNKKVKWNSNICLNGCQHLGHKSNTIFMKNKQVSLQYVLFENELFNELIENNSQYDKSELMYKGDYIDVNFNNKINPHQKNLLKDLNNFTNLNNKLQSLYLESKLFDLIYTSLNSIEKVHKKEDLILNSKDIESLHRAKEFLIDNMMNPPSLKELAYKSAINEFKLKKGFKQLFGNTVYGLLQEHRLEKAKKLLEEGDINISEATQLVGYKSISHFSQIFKKHYGFSPIQIKLNSKKYYI